MTTRAIGKKNAEASLIFGVAMCAKWTRTMFGFPATGDVDKDGDVDAVDAWKAAKSKHPGDMEPPAGVPVYWGGGSKGFGHVAVSIGKGKVRTIDWPVAGKVGTASIAEITRRWGLPYFGWSDDWAGRMIGYPKSATLGRLRKKLKKSRTANKKLKRTETVEGIENALKALEGL